VVFAHPFINSSDVTQLSEETVADQSEHDTEKIDVHIQNR
jgi:hypothetical protein